VNDVDREQLWDTYAEHQLAVRCVRAGQRCDGCSHQGLHVAEAGCLHDYCPRLGGGGICVPPEIVLVAKESPC
jgi:hypothetical protein